MGAILPSERYNEEKNVQQWLVQKVHSFKIAVSDLRWQQYRHDLNTLCWKFVVVPSGLKWLGMGDVVFCNI